jgi:hypothetical protein
MILPTPRTEMLGLYRSLHEPQCRGLQAHLALAQHFRARPDELAARFAVSVGQFSRYSNPRQFFHRGALSPKQEPTAPRTPAPGACAPLPARAHAIERTVQFAACASRAGELRLGDTGPQLRYVDRELDCLRTEPGVRLDDGSLSKRAIVLDLLLEDLETATPVFAELKIGGDEDAFYGLIQALAAAVHLVTPAQRLRLRNVYGLSGATRNIGPYADVYVIFVAPKLVGSWPELLEETFALRDSLLEQPAIASFVRRIEFAHAYLAENSLHLEPAELLLRRGVSPPRGAAAALPANRADQRRRLGELEQG